MKKYWFCEKPAIMTEAEKAQRKFHPVILVIFYLLFGVFLMNYLNFLSSLAIPVSPSSTGYNEIISILAHVLYLIPFSLFLFFVRFVEKRSWASMGVVRNKAMNIYLILMGALIVGGLMVLALMIRQNLKTEFFFEALDGLLIIIEGLCFTIVIYGFLLISLTNRMSMKNAVIVVALIPIIQYVIVIISYLQFSSEAFPMDIGVSQQIIKIILLAVDSIISIAAFALLFLRTNHIWSVAILALLVRFILYITERISSFPYEQIIAIIVSAGILLIVLFWPKKQTKNKRVRGLYPNDARSLKR